MRTLEDIVLNYCVYRRIPIIEENRFDIWEALHPIYRRKYGIEEFNRVLNSMIEKNSLGEYNTYFFG